LRRIVIARVEALRSHLTDVGTTGSLAPLPPDTHGDELSDTVASFNGMAAQLAELRDRLRRQDYTHGAADQAAGILHNVRNAVSPISTITWDLMKAEDAAMKQNLARALQELGAANLPPERAEKLQQFVRMSAARMLQEGDKRRTELEALNAMVRHVDRILKDEDAVSHGARTSEAITLAPCIAAASTLVHGRPGISFVADVPLNARVIGHKVTLEQVLANLLLNAAEAISAQGGAGTISLEVAEIQHNGTPALDLRIRDDGDGIAADRLDAIFERGFSTRRERSSGVGLHWCANAVNAMGGRLYAESPGPGLGATLHLVLPQDRAEHRSAA
jgi:signal transduction histidine kinase